MPPDTPESARCFDLAALRSDMSESDAAVERLRRSSWDTTPGKLSAVNREPVRQKLDPAFEEVLNNKGRYLSATGSEVLCAGDVSGSFAATTELDGLR